MRSPRIHENPPDEVRNLEFGTSVSLSWMKRRRSVGLGRYVGL